MWPLILTKYYDGRKIVSLCVWPSIYYCAFTRSWDWNASLGHLQRCLLSCLGANIMFCFTLIIVIVIIAPCFSTVHFLQEDRYSADTSLFFAGDCLLCMQCMCWWWIPVIVSVGAGSACKMWSRCLLWAAASESSGVAPVLGAAADTGDHWLLQWHTRAESVVSAVSSWVSPAVECAAVCSVVTPAAAASFPVDIEQAECLSTSLSCTTLSLVKWAAVDDDRKQRFKLSTLI